MFKRLFDNMDRKLGENGERWKIILGSVPFLLYILQVIFVFAFTNGNSNERAVFIFLLNTLLVPLAICAYPFTCFAKRKYKINTYWLPFESFAPLLVLGFYFLEVIQIIKIIVRKA